MLHYPTIIFILQICLFERIAGDLNVTLLTFSGRPNPKWVVEVNSEIYTQIQKMLTVVRDNGFAYHPDGIPNKLGYRGFLVKTTSSQTEDFIVGPNTIQLQVELLNSIPKGLLLLGNVEEIKDEMKVVKALKAGGEKSVKRRYAPEFDPQNWNDGGITQLCNNCYNYATTVVTNDFAQPGLGGGLFYGDITPKNLRDAAIKDGLEVEVFNEIPAGDDEHLVALAIAKDIPGYYNGDFHWYRKDIDGYWSHKISDDKVRQAKDGLTNVRIFNLAKAHLGGRYKFVTYMKCNRKNVNIKGIRCL